MSNWEYNEQELWRFGEGEISLYHVFSTVAVGRCVLVFAEARHGDGADAGTPHDIVMRRSTDGGRSFAPSVCLLRANGARCYANPTPIYDAVTGHILLAFAENPDNKATTLYLMESEDLGSTWSAPRDITAAVTKKTDTRFHIPGPGHGIQLQKGPHTGRLLLQLWHRGEDVSLPRAARGYCTSLLYSDDHGATWTHIAPLGAEMLANESRLAECGQGLIWSLRASGQQHALAFGSADGTAWNAPQIAPLPPANACDAGLISLSFGEKYANTVLLSRISGTEKGQRRDMEICISRDGGKSFPARFSLPAGDAMPGYSDLCVIREETPVIGLVHCRCNHVLFSRISLQTLTGGDLDGTARSVWQQV